MLFDVTRRGSNGIASTSAVVSVLHVPWRGADEIRDSQPSTLIISLAYGAAAHWLW